MIKGLTKAKETEEGEFTSALGTIIGVDGSGYIVQIDGEEQARTKRFRANASYRFYNGERVKLSKISGTYVIEYPVESANLGYSAGLTYNKLANASVSWVRDLGGADVSYSSTDDAAVVIRTTDNIAFTSIKTLSCKIWLTSKGSGPLYIGLASTALVLPLANPTYTYFEKYVALSDTGRQYLKLDVSDVEGEYYPTICGAAHAYNFRGFFID